MMYASLLRKAFFLLGICLTAHAQAQVFPSESPLRSGQLLKIEVHEEGVYRITGTDLANAGISLSEIDPAHLQLFGDGGGMLPQPNHAPRTGGLQEIGIWIEGASDGRFDPNDYLLFYGQGPNKVYYDTAFGMWRQETHLYATSNYYFLKLGATEGKRITETEPPGAPSKTIETYTELIHHEEEQTNLLNSGRRWYGEVFNFENTQAFTFNADGHIANASVKILGEVVSQAPVETRFLWELNEQQVGITEFNAVPPTTYGIKGNHQQAFFEIQNLPSVSELTLTIQYDQQGSNANAYLDFFTLNFSRKLGKYAKQQAFRYAHPMPEPVAFEVENVATNDKVWDVSNPSTPIQLPVAFATNARFVGSNHGTYWLFNHQDALAPVAITATENQNLHAWETPELLIITPKAFVSQADRLATFRETEDGIRSRVATTEAIYNEFSSGKPDITALRDFIRSLYLKDSERFRYVLLFGDGSFDYKDRLANNTNYVPIYESVQSLHPIYSYSSDDYFGFMEEREGLWEESFSSNDHDLELGIGRLPITSLAEAEGVVNKLIRYQTSRESLGNWRHRVALVADDGDFNIHQAQADQLGEFIETNHFDFNVERLFVDAFPQETTPFGKKSFALKERINQLVEQGTLIINYSGHGAETGWASEGILDNPQILSWENSVRLPLLVTATCEFGRHEDPTQTSGAEFAILHENGGAIALLTTTRPVFSNTNFTVNKAFYEAVFTPIDGKMPRLGDVHRITKNNSLSGVINRNFTLLGDPSMQLAYPQESAQITHVNGETITETLSPLRALETVTLRGEITKNGNRSSDFQGVAEVVVFDKFTTARTLGDDGPNTIMEYDTRERKLFQGEVTVTDGTFEVQFVIPKNIDYTLGDGKISLYAYHDNQFRDAGGASQSVQIGGSTSGVTPDDTPPILSAFLADRSFVNGGLVTPNTTLLVDVEDAQGINILNNGLGNTLTATLNATTTWDLSTFYSTERDNFTRGTVAFPLRNLPPGKHSLTVQAWDTHHNLAEVTLSFIVTNSDAFTVTEAFAYPSPSRGEPVSFGFSHNKPGEPLNVVFTLFDTSGKRIIEKEQQFLNSPSVVSVAEWQTEAFSTEQGAPTLYPYVFQITYPATGETLTQHGKVLLVR